ncbi:hypothetical protein H5410_001946 [Solanum commersonii]|uniref:SWIM-type domain-containing protein n=1 Tax=Solanum commersonii TaxID=4109 RepID=A0A9J6B089_SOLCO|nr:hypothetical protein H5410_001946 [Solanum commersonii]
MSHRMIVHASTEHVHIVIDDAKSFTVCLNTRMCSCGRFQHDEIACSHAIAVISYRNKHHEDYCSTYYSNKNFQDTYAIPIVLLLRMHLEYSITYFGRRTAATNYKKKPDRPPSNDCKKGFTEEKYKKE